MSLSLVQPALIHFLEVCHALEPDEIAQVEALTGEEFDADVLAAQIFNARGPKWTVRNEKGWTLVVAGFHPVRRGVYTSFFAARPRAWAAHGKEITRLAKRTMAQMLAYNDGENGVCHRIERSVLSSRKLAKRWYGTIGLKHESTMLNYGANGETFDMYVATRDLGNT